MEAKLLVDARAGLGEGPWWDDREGVLYWVDITGRSLHRYHPQTGQDELFDVGEMVGTVVLGRSGRIYLAVKEGFAHFDLATGRLHYLARPADHPADNRFNDGKCSPEGRFWAGTMGMPIRLGAGALYRLDPDGRCHHILGGITVSNGLVWSADQRTMYYIDSPPRTVTAFGYDPATGAIDNGHVVITVPEGQGVPDGMAIDVEGRLWIAHFGGWSVRCWDPESGEQIAQIEVPVENVTACAFGGPDMRTLYITTHGGQKSDRRAEPYAGGLFAAELDVAGQGNYRFAD